MSLTFRILLGFLVIGGLSFAFLLDRVLLRIERQYLEAAEDPMVDAANLIAGFLAADWENGGSAWEATVNSAMKRNPGARIYQKLKQRIEMDFYITDARGIIVFDSSGMLPEGADHSRKLEIYHTLRGNYGARSSRLREEDAASSIMFVAAPVHDSYGRLVGVVSIYKPQQSLHEFIGETRRVLRGFAIFAMLAMLAGGLLASRWITAPVRKLTDYVAAVAGGKKPKRPKLSSRSMDRLAAAFEEMRDSLDGRGAIESYVQTLTHEMKSPVSAIRGAAELLDEPMPEAQRKKFLANIRMETERLARLTEGLLLLSSVENQKELQQKRSVDLCELLEAVVQESSPLAAAQGVPIELDCRDRLRITGETGLLHLAVANLLKNALEFSPPGAGVGVVLRKEAGEAVIEVLDHGPGIPDFAKEKVFERFFSLPRPQTGRKSTGLGLCLAREAVALHAGKLELAPRPGGGTLATILLPAR
jgi:two-component system, OmpR family, sensor histidine kinase CreC